MRVRYMMAGIVPVLLAVALLWADDLPKKTKFALLIGVKDYSEGSGLRNLDYTENDVAALAEVLEKQGYDVTILTRSESFNQKKDHLRPTAKNIRNHLARLAKDRKKGDTLLVGMTGHGAHLKRTNKLYFCPLETELSDEKTLVAVDDVLDLLKPANCKASMRVLFVDACRNDPADGASAVPPDELASVTRPLIPAPEGGTVALFSCKKGQISHESQTHQRGFLFHHVIEGLGGKAANKQGEVTWLRLANYVVEELPESVRKDKGPTVVQTPEVLGNVVGGTGEFALAKYAPQAELREPKAGEEREYEIAKGVKMKFCWIPAGKATLGSPAGEEGRRDDAGEHGYETKGFWLGKYEVTQKEWESVMGNNPSYFVPSHQTVKDAGIVDTSRFPVENVSWKDCQEFLKKLNAGGGVEAVFGKRLQFALPHEDAWEYAYRGGGGNKQPFYWGSRLNGDYANCDGKYPYGTETEGPYLRRPAAVGSYAGVARHPWGLCDMSGNVWEWCENLYSSEQKGRVLRGGSWVSYPVICRAAYRDCLVPGDRSFNVGFRLCLD